MLAFSFSRPSPQSRPFPNVFISRSWLYSLTTAAVLVASAATSTSSLWSGKFLLDTFPSPMVPFVSGFRALYTQLSFWLSVPTDGRELDSGRQQLVRWRCCTDYNTDQCWRIRCRTALNDKVTLNILSTRHPLGAEVRYFSRSLSQASLEEFQNKSERSMPLRASVRVDSGGGWLQYW